MFRRTIREAVLLRMPVQMSICESRDQDSERGSISINDFVGLPASRTSTERELECSIGSVNALY